MVREPRRIAVFRMGHLGDMVIAMPALWTVRRRFPNAHILFLNQEHKKGKLAQGLDVIRPGSVYDDNLGYRLGEGGVSKADMVAALVKLRLARIDTLVYIPAARTPAQLKRDRLFFRLAGVRRIIGMTGFAETDYRPAGSPLPTVTHEADLLLSHMARDGVTPDVDPHTLVGLGLTDEERAFARAYLAEKGVDLSKPVIGVGPGSKMPAKLWPLERFLEVVQALDTEFSPTVIAFGSAAERETCGAIADAATRGLNAAGELTIRQSAAVFEHCALYLGNDTGTMHLAASAGVRCVAIFSARDWPGRWYPYGKGHVVHRVVVPCEGCMLEVCDRENLCLTEIGAERVLESARRVLRETPAGPRSP